MSKKITIANIGTSTYRNFGLPLLSFSIHPATQSPSTVCPSNRMLETWNLFIFLMLSFIKAFNFRVLNWNVNSYTCRSDGLLNATPSPPPPPLSLLLLLLLFKFEALLPKLSCSSLRCSSLSANKCRKSATNTLLHSSWAATMTLRVYLDAHVWRKKRKRGKRRKRREKEERREEERRRENKHKRH